MMIARVVMKLYDFLTSGHSTTTMISFCDLFSNLKLCSVPPLSENSLLGQILNSN